MERLDSGKLAPYYNSANSKLIASLNSPLLAENSQSSNKLQQQLQQQQAESNVHLFSTKKRLCGEPCVSLTVSAFVNAVAQASFIDPAEIQSRNDALNTQLRNKKLSTIDVVGDDNCFFWALSVSLHMQSTLSCLVESNNRASRR